MLDMQKESLFNILQSSFPNEGALDVFAGSGGLGLEALSRGAERATFVERARPAAETIRENIRLCGFEDRARVVVADAFSLDLGRLDHPVAVVFCDPPFPLWVENPERIVGLLDAMAAAPNFVPDGVVMLRIPKGSREPSFGPTLAGFDRRAFGESVLFLARRPAPPVDA